MMIDNINCKLTEMNIKSYVCFMLLFYLYFYFYKILINASQTLKFYKLNNSK